MTKKCYAVMMEWLNVHTFTKLSDIHPKKIHRRLYIASQLAAPHCIISIFNLTAVRPHSLSVSTGQWGCWKMLQVSLRSVSGSAAYSVQSLSGLPGWPF